MKNLPAGNKQADYSINNSVFVQEDQTTADMCMNRCEALDIVLYLGHLRLMKIANVSNNKKINRTDVSS